MRNFIIFIIVFISSCKSSDLNSDIKSVVEIEEDSVPLKQCIKCDLDLCKIIDTFSANISTNNINCFIESLNNKCKDNVEFSEFSNSILFKISYKQADEILNALDKDNIDTAYILDIYRNPLLDYDIDSLISIFEQSKINSRFKTQIIKQLKDYKATEE